MVRNESVRFGRHIDIEVSYKILQLEIQKLVLILHCLACFQKGLFGGNFVQKHPWSFRG
jgi:TRAP-type C4-dicarboxylate transport system permease small subunit